MDAPFLAYAGSTQKSLASPLNVVESHPGVEYRRHGLHDENPSNLTPGYTLDLAGDPCVIVLRRAGEGVVARFT
jgi:hypothetical protein